MPKIGAVLFQTVKFFVKKSADHAIVMGIARHAVDKKQRQNFDAVRAQIGLHFKMFFEGLDDLGAIDGTFAVALCIALPNHHPILKLNKTIAPTHNIGHHIASIGKRAAIGLFIHIITRPKLNIGFGRFTVFGHQGAHNGPPTAAMRHNIAHRQDRQIEVFALAHPNHLNLFDQIAAKGIDGGEAKKPVGGLAMGGAKTQGQQGVEGANGLERGLALHLLRLVHDDNRAGALNVFDRFECAGQFFVVFINDIAGLVECVERDEQDLAMAAAGKTAHFAQLSAVIFDQIDHRIAI